MSATRLQHNLERLSFEPCTEGALIAPPDEQHMDGGIVY
jgi:hypothetical protein